MKKKVSVDILGHKAHVEYISGHLAKSAVDFGHAPKPWWRDDEIKVRLSFDEPVGSTAGIAVSLPVRSYTVAEFLEAVRLEGEKRLQAEIERDQFRREEQKLEGERRATLNQKVEEIRALVGLD